MAGAYTKKQAAVIDDAWFVIMRAVEHSHQQERRLSNVLKKMKKEFSVTASKSHTIRNVAEGMGIVKSSHLWIRDDETILSNMVGQYLINCESQKDKMGVLIEFIKAALATEDDAQIAYLDSICEKMLDNLNTNN